MNAVYLSEIIALMLFVVALIMGFSGAYLLIRYWHRKWYWEDEVRKNQMLKSAMREAGIHFEVGDDGFVRPVDNMTPRSSGRSRD